MLRKFRQEVKLRSGLIYYEASSEEAESQTSSWSEVLQSGMFLRTVFSLSNCRVLHSSSSGLWEKLDELKLLPTRVRVVCLCLSVVCSR